MVRRKPFEVIESAISQKTITFVYRAEVSHRAAEVDALNDQLTEERKRCRDLQWAMEKEKCQTGRTEESKREELEVITNHFFYITI